MDSYEFMRSITHDLGSIKIFFDATMALYQIAGEYDGFRIIGKNADDSSASFAYTFVPPKDPLLVEKFIRDINGLDLGIYGRYYKCGAEMPNQNTIIVTLHSI